MAKLLKKKQHRYWRRVSTPKKWWPWGFVPLAAIGVVFLFGVLLMAPRIEAEVREQVSLRFDGAGLLATDIRGDGQGVIITATAQSEDELYLRSLAASTRCNTWAGQLTCPTSVEIRRADDGLAPNGQ